MDLRVIFAQILYILSRRLVGVGKLFLPVQQVICSASCNKERSLLFSSSALDFSGSNDSSKRQRISRRSSCASGIDWKLGYQIKKQESSGFTLSSLPGCMTAGAPDHGGGGKGGEASGWKLAKKTAPKPKYDQHSLLGYVASDSKKLRQRSSRRGSRSPLLSKFRREDGTPGH
ncbi:hypothetical protein LMH87_005521 [Akanthomyces muscarius]|uniref:Uncharacterized protein n=1 Tax=Akanthomyces muscarius TaxID=2231603 RepID=A0A9W8QPC6_AKAMU|nr:hypothetical protein LMH87_005521 [Akanthomyces muscarius]KAJ4163817.1 hypothetical protein LMH87_005521 [Akanthomyces muscarius]